MGKVINIQALTPGMVIIRVTQQNGPVKIRKTGLVSSQAMVQGLIEMGIQEVEIDPEQTVEVEPPKVNKSATQKMLESNHVTNTRIDDGLSDQFHRSLFLPSVQDIPSAWLFYTKRYGLAVLIAIAGFGLGWAVSHYEGVKKLFVSAPVIEPNLDKSVVEAAPPQVNKSGNLSSSETVDSENEVISTQALPTQESSAQLPQNDEKLVPQTSDKAHLVKEATPELAPEPATTPLEEQPISADLLAKFREAVSEVGEDAPNPEVQNAQLDNGVSRIDQLPVWVLTELPNMSFSAHMYASDDAERWVRVNGTRMVEGDMIESAVEIISISPQQVILSYKGHKFIMDALTDW
ncbi:MAG: general secretion pathway protein GspB [Paraglaciecola sp.]|uniref:general secretion pathway protein GspB n=1 Tax=Paraglaciecola sp. TaxID=1920173 RepID=UPI003297CEED